MWAVTGHWEDSCPGLAPGWAAHAGDLVARVSISEGCQTRARGWSETVATERGMTDMVEPKSYQLFMQICGATGLSWFLIEETAESRWCRAMWARVGAATISIFPSLRQAWQGLAKDPPPAPSAPSPNGNLFFFPKHQLKSKDTGSPSLADAVETIGNFRLEKLRSPSAYSLRVQAALRNAFVLSL